MNDTHPSIHKVQLEMLKSLTQEERFRKAMRFSSGVFKLSRAQFEMRFGELGLQRWLEVHYGKRLARGALGSRYCD
jgi:hypothetical protein